MRVRVIFDMFCEEPSGYEVGLDTNSHYSLTEIGNGF